MSDPVTQSQFYGEMQRFREEAQARHVRTSDAMREGFEKLAAKLEQHKRDDEIVAAKVLVIETERKTEKTELATKVAQRSTLTSVVISTAAMVIYKMMDRYWR